MSEKRLVPADETIVLSPFIITLIYAVIGGMYILLSDRFVASLVKDPGTLTTVQTVKGWAYVFVTAAMLYLLIRSLARQLQRLLLRATQSEQKFRDLVDLLPEPVFETDLHGGLTYANGKFLTSLNLSADDLNKGVNVFDHVAPGERSLAGERFARILREEILGAREYLLLKKGGGMFPAMVHTARIMRAGEVLGIRGVVVDISERKKLEEELSGYRQRLEEIVAKRTAEFADANRKLAQEIAEREETEAKLLLKATILDKAGEAILLLNPKGDFVYANEAASNTYGYSRDEFLTLNLRQLMQPQDASLTETRLQEVIKKEQQEQETVHLRKDGSVLPVQVRHRLIRTRHGEFIVSIIRELAD